MNRWLLIQQGFYFTSNGDNACISFDTCKTWINLFVSSYASAAFIHGDDLYLSTFGGPAEKSTQTMDLPRSTIPPSGNTENVSIYDFHYKDSNISCRHKYVSGVYSSRTQVNMGWRSL
ncbi:MAG: hypothetical protein IPN13_10915 [Bacteroidetes bacterium]|nr:hypothetical protein [Bacteroidota bacterium]